LTPRKRTKNHSSKERQQKNRSIKAAPGHDLIKKTKSKEQSKHPIGFVQADAQAPQQPRKAKLQAQRQKNGLQGQQSSRIQNNQWSEYQRIRKDPRWEITFPLKQSVKGDPVPLKGKLVQKQLSAAVDHQWEIQMFLSTDFNAKIAAGNIQLKIARR
jgi:hypothetical protein